MANYIHHDIKALREDRGRHDGRQEGLDEADGDAKAEDILRVKGLRASPSEAARPPMAWSSPRPVTASAPSEVLCETDFVAKGRAFRRPSPAGPRPGRGHQGRGRADALLSALAGRPDRPGTRRRSQRDDRRERSRSSALRASGPHVVAYLHKTALTCPRRSVSSSVPRVATRDRSRCRDASRPSPVGADPRRDRPATVEHERKVAGETARRRQARGPPSQKIIEGSGLGFFKEAVLLEQALRQGRQKSVQKVLGRPGPPRERPLPRRHDGSRPRHLVCRPLTSGGRSRHRNVRTTEGGRRTSGRQRSRHRGISPVGPSSITPGQGHGAPRCSFLLGAILPRPCSGRWRDHFRRATDAVEGVHPPDLAPCRADTRSLLRVRAGPRPGLFAIGATSLAPPAQGRSCVDPAGRARPRRRR